MTLPGDVVGRGFYLQPTVEVARQLLGTVLVRRTPEGIRSGVIVETEAYLTGDAAAHSFAGRTERNASMWEEPGHAYVYFIYGVHWMLNFVTQPPGIGEAVLIRAADPLDGTSQMRAALGYASDAPPRRLANGPGKLAKAFGITRALEGADLCDASGPLSVHVGRSQVPDADVATTTRIGITRDAHHPWRFYVKSSPSVSRR